MPKGTTAAAEIRTGDLMVKSPWSYPLSHNSSYVLIDVSSCSTETALLRIKHDFHKSFDSKSGTVLVRLDLKSAFDTVDHAIMLEGLYSNYAISGLALQWFRSYLADRHFSVCVRNETSDKCPLKYGFSQGSVLGPLLFTLYIKPLSDIIRRHNVKFHIYADDIQMYYSFDPKSVDSLHNAISVLEKCISEV